MRELRILPAAETDLEDIWIHIAADEPQAADAFIDQFAERFEALRRSPHLGPDCSELAPDLRRFPTRGYVVFYSVRDDALVIERVLHGARDMDALFE